MVSCLLEVDCYSIAIFVAQSQLDLGFCITLSCSLALSLKRLLEVDCHSFAILVAQSQIVLFLVINSETIDDANVAAALADPNDEWSIRRYSLYSISQIWRELRQEKCVSICLWYSV